MKKNKLVVSLSLIIFVFIVSCNNATTSQKEESQKTDTTSVQAASLYVCPMHENVTSDKPGTCSECGMDLEKKN